jgi:nitrile hydratase alpha subunit
MSDHRASMGPHDLGGEPGGPIDPADYGMTHWQKQANALLMVVARNRISTIDEMRRGREDLEKQSDTLGYFERQTESLASNLVERGRITWDVLRARMAEIGRRFEVPIVALPDHDPHGDHDHDHAHDHDHHHEPTQYQEDDTGEPPHEHQLMSLAMQDLLEALGLVTAEEVRRMIESFDDDYPYRGAKVVARAWTDPDFKKRLLQDARKVIEGEMGLDLEVQARIIALENTPSEHNVIVCTLCSCYPRFLLGHPPTWYKSRNYRSRVVHEPRAVLREFGTVLGDDVTVRVHDSNAEMRYLVVPMRPAGTEGWDEAALEKIISRDSLVGVTVPKV